MDPNNEKLFDWNNDNKYYNWGECIFQNVKLKCYKLKTLNRFWEKDLRKISHFDLEHLSFKFLLLQVTPIF